MMRIGIDISQVVYGTGVSTYTRNLVSELLIIDKENKYVLFGGYLRRKSDLERFFDALEGNFEKRLYPIPPTLADFLWNRVHKVNIEKLIGKVDVYHSSNWSQPPTNAFNVTTVHDLVPLFYPEQSNPKLVAVHKRRLERVKVSVNRVIVPSNATKHDLRLAGISKEKIRVIPEAPEITERAKKSDIDKLKKSYGIVGKYLLSIGVNNRKNTERIIKAFERIGDENNIKLVIIGYPHINLNVPQGVMVLGHVPHDELSAFYSGAEALLYPSLYEGFGIPILEAYTCKVPVVTSRSGSMKEVAGNASELVDPEDVNSITNGIAKVLSNREKYIKLGKKEVEKYKWKKTAEMTLDVYKESQK
jgi:glycosyltransferase involved in cell wall biosynthesis